MADKEGIYGQNWIICLTPEAKDVVLDKAKAEEKAKNDAIEKIRLEAEAEVARKKAEEDAINNAVFEDKPFVARPYVSKTADETVEEVDELNVHNRRDLIRANIMRRGRDFGRDKNSKFNVKPAESQQWPEWRKHKDPHFDLLRSELHIGLQACASWTESYLAIERAERRAAGIGVDDKASPPGSAAGSRPGSQGGRAGSTHSRTGGTAQSNHADGWGLDAEQRLVGQVEEQVSHMVCQTTQSSFFRACNNSVQCSTGDLALAHQSGAGAVEPPPPPPHGAEAGHEGGDVMEGGVFKDFLTRAGGFCEQALQQNEIVDIFSDEFSFLGDDDHSFG